MQKKEKKNPPSAPTTHRKPGKAATTLRGNRTKSQAGRGEKEATYRFVKDLVVRGEAAKLTQEGKLPLSATHVVTKEHKDGTVEVRRVRYKAF